MNLENYTIMPYCRVNCIVKNCIVNNKYTDVNNYSIFVYMYITLINLIRFYYFSFNPSTVGVDNLDDRITLPKNNKLFIKIWRKLYIDICISFYGNFIFQYHPFSFLMQILLKKKWLLLLNTLIYFLKQTYINIINPREPYYIRFQGIIFALNFNIQLRVKEERRMYIIRYWFAMIFIIYLISYKYLYRKLFYHPKIRISYCLLVSFYSNFIKNIYDTKDSDTKCVK